MSDPERPEGFWKGYRRDAEMVEALTTFVRIAMKARPTWRLGQIIANLLEDDDLFQIHDEELARRLALVGGEYFARCPNAPHTSGLVYHADKDMMVCPICGHEQWEEMGG